LKCHVLSIIWIFLHFDSLRLSLLLDPVVLVFRLRDELKRLLTVASLQGVFDIEELIEALLYKIIFWQLSSISVHLELYRSSIIVGIRNCIILLNLFIIFSKLLSYEFLLLTYLCI